MATDSMGSATGMTVQGTASARGPLDGWTGMLRSDTVRKVLSALACMVAFGWLVAVTGVGVIVMNASSSQRAEATKLPDPVPVAPALAAAPAPMSKIPDGIVSPMSVAPSMPEAMTALAPSEPTPVIASAPPMTLRTATISASGLRLREQPTTQGRVLETLVGGAVVSVLDGATERDGLQWVPVRIAGDKLGWVASDGLE
jgi:hypothetical protein